MSEFWKALPGWVRHVAVPIILAVVALWLVVGIISAVVGAVTALFWFAFKVLVIVALGAAVVVLVKKARR